MLRVKNSFIYALALMGLDAVLVIAAFFISFQLRNAYYLIKIGEGPISIDLYFWLIPVLIAVHLGTMAFTGIYYSSRRQLYVATSWQVIQGVVLGGLLSASIVFYTKSQLLSRLYFALFSVITLILMLLAHNAVVYLLGWLHRQGFHQRRVLIVSDPKKIERALALFKKQPQWGFMPVGYLSALNQVQEKKAAGLLCLGKYSEAEKVFESHIIDEVFFNVAASDLEKIQPIIELCEIHGAPFHFYSDILPVKYSKPRLDFFLDEPVLSYYRRYLSMDQKIIKRILDFIGGFIGSLLTLFITPFIFILIKFEDRGPVFFVQQRVGVNRRPFYVIKFRTMRVDAEQIRKKLEEKNEMKGNLFKMKNDPRVTKVGNFLRKTSLDEFPQFFNVLLGQMSLVGPRPLPLSDMTKYDSHHYRRLRAKPGLTGFWQVRGRNKIVSYERMVELDNRYIDYWSIGLDLKIIWQTLKILLLKKTGY
jgi:exopolysaccharide biosynthesis polyprenyl glycosylphosphotransferase